MTLFLIGWVFIFFGWVFLTLGIKTDKIFYTKISTCCWPVAIILFITSLIASH